MNLVRALRFDEVESMAFVGAGGKTTTMFQLARQLTPPVLVTTTTHIGTWQVKLADRHLIIDKDSQLDLIEEQLKGVVLITGPLSRGERMVGLDNRQLEHVHQFAQSTQTPLLIEADGSRQRPIKAPGSSEPVIPAFVDAVVVVVGLSALDQNLTETWVHRPNRFAQITGLSSGDRITLDSLVKMLTHPGGGLKDIPDNARIIAMLTQVRTQNLQAKGKRLAQHLLPIYQSVILTSLADNDKFNITDDINDYKQSGIDMQKVVVFAVLERVAGIVLAAGGSVRLGEPKQLLLWRGKPFIEQVVSIARESGLWPIVVVTGAYRDQIEPVIKNLAVQEVQNIDWESGQSTSIRAGLEVLPQDVGAVVFLLVDQPQVSPRLVQNLVEYHTSSLAPVVAPQINGQRGNPVLFDRSTFSDLMNLKGDNGGRALFSKYSPSLVNWGDQSILHDVDTFDDYHSMIARDK